VIFRTKDLGRVNTVAQFPQMIGTLPGSEESGPGLKVSGGNVSPSGDVDAVVGGAADDAAGGGVDLDEGAVCDGSTGEDRPPFGAAVFVVPGKDAGKRGSCLVNVSDAGIPKFCQDFSVSTHAIDWFPGKRSSDPDAIDAALPSLDLPPPSSARVGP
jgi:hypothetical protein